MDSNVIIETFDLRKSYGDRVIRLKDGKIIDDTAPQPHRQTRAPRENDASLSEAT